MWRVQLTEAQQVDLRQLREDATLTPAERDRVEMLALSAAGWSVARIAPHLGYHPETVRRFFRAFAERAGDWAVVRHQPTGPAPDQTRRAAIEAALGALLAQRRTWTAVQLAEALRADDIVLSGRQVRRYLTGMGAGWRRTVRTLRHKQQPEAVTAAREELAVLANGQKQAR
jgi:transposase